MERFAQSSKGKELAGYGRVRRKEEERIGKAKKVEERIYRRELNKH